MDVYLFLYKNDLFCIQTIIIKDKKIILYSNYIIINQRLLCKLCLHLVVISNNS